MAWQKAFERSRSFSEHLDLHAARVEFHANDEFRIFDDAGRWRDHFDDLRRLRHRRIEQFHIRLPFGNDAGILPKCGIAIATIASVRCGEIKFHITPRRKLHTQFMMRAQRRHWLLPGFRAVFFTDVAHAGESPQNLLPRFDVGGGELLLAKLCPERIEQNGWLSASERGAEDLQVFCAQALSAAASLKCIEILRDRQTTATSAGVQLDPLCEGLRAFSRGRVFGIKRPNGRQRFIRPILRRSAGRPPHAMWRENRVRSDFLRRIEILGEQRRRHNQRCTHIREAFTRCTIDGKLLRWI